MSMRFRGPFSVLFAAGYLAQSLMLSVGHVHVEPEQKSHFPDAAEHRAVAEHAGLEPSACCGTHRAPLAKPGPEDGPDRQHSCPAPVHDPGDCSVCRHLLAKPVLVDPVPLPQIRGCVTSVEPCLPVFYGRMQTRYHFSRSPPAERC